MKIPCGILTFWFDANSTKTGAQQASKKTANSERLPFSLEKVFFVLMGCNKKLYNVLGGFTSIIIPWMHG